MERAEKYPTSFVGGDKVNKIKLRFAANWWSEMIYAQQNRTDTHDLAFIVQPALRREYDLYVTKRAKDAVVNAAYHLAMRYNSDISLIKSWDSAKNHRYSFGGTEDYLVIIDNMMNLDMLFWATQQTGDLSLATIAINHADTTLKNHFRPDFSTYHLVNYDPATGEPKAHLTNQGWTDDSTWSRGQAWAISGYANCYQWTKDIKYLKAAIASADYFNSRLSSDGVPAWDFDAPSDDIKDVSAGLIAAKGLMDIFKVTGDKVYLERALFMVNAIIEHCLGSKSTISNDGKVDLGTQDSILIGSTQNNNPDAYKKYHSHGLAYADYYFIEFGNTLLDMGITVD